MGWMGYNNFWGCRKCI